MTANPVIAAWWPAIGFVLLGGVSLLVLALRRWPLPKRAAKAAPPLDTPLVGPTSIWHAGVLHTIKAPRFGALCEAMFEQDGSTTSPMPTASSLGEDFWLHRSDEPLGSRRTVRCRPWADGTIDGIALRRFHDRMVEAGASAGIFIAAAGFDAEAIASASALAITLVDGTALMKLITQRSERQQRALRDLVREPAAPRPALLTITPTPAPTWLAVAGISLLAAWLAWPAPRATLSLQADAEAPPGASGAVRMTDERDDERSRFRPSRSAPATVADLDPAPAPVMRPAAGRQVLRCVSAGHIAYLDADARCPEGTGERVTVFPTQGVNPLR